MRLQRLRLTLGRMMAAVAVVALVLGSVAEFSERGRLFRARADFFYGKTVNGRPAEAGGAIILRDGRAASRERWYQAMGRKYDYAASHPWLPVAADTPPPK